MIYEGHVSLKHSKETYIQVLQTVPAEGVFAAHAQHLRAALVPLDVGAAHGALLDRQVQTAVATDPAQIGTRAEKGTSGSTWKSTDMQASLFPEQSVALYLAIEEGSALTWNWVGYFWILRLKHLLQTRHVARAAIEF